MADEDDDHLRRTYLSSALAPRETLAAADVIAIRRKELLS
jgi:hypothetical protein